MKTQGITVLGTTALGIHREQLSLEYTRNNCPWENTRNNCPGNTKGTTALGIHREQLF
jgi:hypothetical protein